MAFPEQDLTLGSTGQLHRPDISIAERVAYEVEEIRSLIPEGLGDQESHLLGEFAIHIGEKAADDSMFDSQLEQEAYRLADEVYRMAEGCRDQIIEKSQLEAIGNIRARDLPQILAAYSDHYLRRLVHHPNHLLSQEERLKQAEYILYFGHGFRDALVSGYCPLPGSNRYAVFLPNDTQAFTNYHIGSFVAHVGTGNEKGIGIMEVVTERLTTFRAPDYHPTPPQLDVLLGRKEHRLPFLNRSGSYLSFVAWAATLEAEAGLETDTKERFNEAMAHYGYEWEETSQTYRWVHK